MDDSGWMRRKGRPRVSTSDSESVAAKAPQVLKIMEELGIPESWCPIRYRLVVIYHLLYSNRTFAPQPSLGAPPLLLLVCLYVLYHSK